MTCWLVPTIIGVTLMWRLDRKQYKIGVLFGYYLVGSFVASLVLALQMPATNLGGYTKRITASGMVFLAYCVGNIGMRPAARPHDVMKADFVVVCTCPARSILAFRWVEDDHLTSSEKKQCLCLCIKASLTLCL